MDLKTLSSQIENLDAAPPFDQWHPPFCGDIDMTIKADGSWWYMGSPIGREKLVKLFASVLLKDGDDYYLKTPAEQVRIQVEDAPYIITQWQQHQTDKGDVIEVSTNLGHKVLLSERHPLSFDGSNPDNPRLYVDIHRGLKALVHRNVYYQWVALGQQQVIDDQTHLMLFSGGVGFSLGQC
ncbi:MAG: DUF1285 domain-containing protein [Alteromonadaceae bacterium]|nr:DUF1285 domain-containing protein [Alteromonadaceae bacterium]